MLSAAGGGALGALAAAADELWKPAGDLLSITGPFVVALWCMARTSSRALAAAGRAAVCFAAITVAYYFVQGLQLDVWAPPVGYLWLALALTAAPAGAALLHGLARSKRMGVVNSAALVAGWVASEPFVLFSDPARLATVFSVLLGVGICGEAIARRREIRPLAGAAFAAGMAACFAVVLVLGEALRAV